MTGGYGLEPMLNISLRQSEVLVGVINQFLENKEINYQYKRRDSDGIPGKITINDNKGIKKLYNLGSGTFIQIAERMEYVNAVIRKYGGKTICGQENLLCQIYKPWEDMQSFSSGKKYTIDFFVDEFGIESIEDTFDAPDPEYPDSLSTEYVAGAFDGSGMITLNIGEDPSRATGYMMSITAGITISNPDIRIKPNFIQYFQKHGFEPGISERDDRLEIRFSSIDGVERFIEKVGADTTYLYSLCELFYSQLIPAFKDQYHTTKEGFLDMLRAYEEIAPERKRAKYTTDYFNQEWDIGV